MKTRQAEERKHEIKVGLTILAALIILVIAILSVGQQRGLLEDRYKLHCHSLSPNRRRPVHRRRPRGHYRTIKTLMQYPVLQK